MKEVLLPSLLVIGVVIGLGIFSMPSVFYSMGILPYLILLLLTGVMILVVVMYGEIIGQFSGIHNFYTYFSKIIGYKFKPYIFLLEFLALESVLLVYSFYLRDTFSFQSGLYFLILGHLVNFLGIKIFKKFEYLLTSLLLILLLILSLYGFFYGNWQNLNLSWKSDINYYGLFLFSLTGFSVFPLLKMYFEKDFGKKYLKTVIFSYVVIFLFYLIFSLSMVVFFGPRIRPEFILSSGFPQNFFWLISILIVVNIFTTFIAIAVYLKEGLIFDWSLNSKLASFIVFLPNIILYFFNLGSFLKFLEITSSIFIGLMGILISLAYLKIKNKRYFLLPSWLVVLVTLVFILGIFSIF